VCIQVVRSRLINITEEEKAAAKKEKEERKAAEKAEKEDKRKSVELEGEGKPERKSLLSRLASKRKSRNITKDEADNATAGTTTAAAAGTTAVVTDDTVDTTRSSTGDAEVLGAPISPVHTKDSTGSKSKTMPNLERHITNIETSSESESDSEETRLRKREKKAQKSAILAGATAANDDDNEAFVSPNEGPVTPIRSMSIEPPPTASTTATKSSGELPNENSSTVATKSIAERVLASPVDAPRALAETPTDAAVDAPVVAPVVAPVDPVRESTASSRPDLEKEKAQETKRSRGFFSRFRNRHSKAERQPGSFSGTSGKPTTGAESSTAATTAAPATATAAAVTSSTDPRAASPSSFTRRRHSSSDDGVATPRKSSLSLSDVSSLSSGLDEDDIQEGRTGRMARAEKKQTAGVADVDGLAPTAAGKGVRSDDDDSDQFEEARDHFDEGLAPRPSFGGQAKSASPARETRFKEEV
jgi:hypothetical protein